VLTYIQGFNNQPGNITRPFVNLSARHGFGGVLDLGLMANFGGFNIVGLGPFLAIRGGKYTTLTLGSQNLTGLIAPNSASGVDVTVAISLQF
jgi:hypothetical protein